MIPQRPNTEVTKLTRPGKMDKYGDLSLATLWINEPCRFVRKPKLVIDGIGEKVTVDAVAEFGGSHDICVGDQIELSLPREPAYTVFSIEDRTSVDGTTTGSVLNLVKEAQQ